MCSSRLLVLLLLFTISLFVSAGFQQQPQERNFYDYAVEAPFEMLEKRAPFQFHAARGKRGDLRNSKYGYFPSRGRRSQIEDE